jgi:hypothetical protein
MYLRVIKYIAVMPLFVFERIRNSYSFSAFCCTS